jgi:hypothetical protein
MQAKYYFGTKAIAKYLFEDEKAILRSFRECCGSTSKFINNKNDGDRFDVEYIPYIDQAIAAINEFMVEKGYCFPEGSKISDSSKISGSILDHCTTLESFLGDIYRVSTDHLSTANFISVDFLHKNGKFPMSFENNNRCHFYQSLSGDPVFLHPLCIKCLFTEIYLEYITRQRILLSAIDIQIVQDNEEKKLLKINRKEALKDLRKTINKLTLKSMIDEMQSSSNQSENSFELPLNIEAPVLQIDNVRVDANVKQMIPFIRHFPIGSTVILVEVDLTKHVSKDVLNLFKNELEHREFDRKSVETIKLTEYEEDEFDRYESP